MKKLLILISIILASTIVYASDNFEISQNEQIVKETDLGRTFVYNLTNKSDKDIFIKINELGYKRDTKEIIEVEGKALEIENLNLTIKPDETLEHRVRVKFSSKNYFDLLPIVEYSSYTDKNYTEPLEKEYIYFYIQNLNGEYKTDLNLNINTSDITNSDSFDANIEITNSGDKFFSNKAKLILKKDNSIIKEIILDEKLTNKLFPLESDKLIETIIIEDQSISSMGEYILSLEVLNTMINKTKVISINFMYIPNIFIYITIGVFSFIIISTILFSIIKKKRNSNNEQFNN